MSAPDIAQNRHLVASGRNPVPAVTLKVLAVAAISLGALSSASLAGAAVGIGLVFWLWGFRRGESIGDRHIFRWAGLAVLLGLFVRLSKSVDPVRDVERYRPIWVTLLALAAVLSVVWGNRRNLRLVSIAIAMLAVATITVTMTVDEWRSELGLDVYWAHRSAGEALFQGENPYTDAVRVFNGSPYSPAGSVIEGYSYPPVALGTYAISSQAVDPRLVSSVAWLAVLGWMAWHAGRRGSEGDTAYAMFLLMAGMAIWPVVWYAAWTEPLSIGLWLLTAVWWRKRPVWSAIALGLAIASKQYFIFLLPLVLLQKDESRVKRAVVSLSVALGTTLVGLIPDPSAYVKATILNLANIGFRPDSKSLSGFLASNGIEFYIPPVWWIALGLAIALLLSRGVVNVAELIGRSALILGLVLFFGQAFMNYWFLVAALLAISTVLSARDRTVRVEGLGEQPVSRQPTLRARC